MRLRIEIDLSGPAFAGLDDAKRKNRLENVLMFGAAWSLRTKGLPSATPRAFGWDDFANLGTMTVTDEPDLREQVRVLREALQSLLLGAHPSTAATFLNAARAALDANKGGTE